MLDSNQENLKQRRCLVIRYIQKIVFLNIRNKGG